MASLSCQWTHPSTVLARFMKYIISYAKQNKSVVYVGYVD